MFKSTGTLIYSDSPYKLIVEVDDDLGNYYRQFIPRAWQVRKPMYPSHISIVRNEAPPNLSVWNKYQNKEIDFEYDSFIYFDEIYYWLNAYSAILEDIRLELGLPNLSEFTKSPDGKHRFHITIGNTKHLL
jgi:hypothetical protein